MEAKVRSGNRKSGTVERVMTVMAELAVEKGLDALSMRDVAKRAGISLAALQHHFPSKDALTAAFVDSLLETYLEDIRIIRNGSDAANELRDFVVYAVGQTLEDRTGDLFAMLEARSRHDQATRSALDRFMRLYLEMVRDIVLRRHPDLSMMEALFAATKIVATIEGLCSVGPVAQEMGLDVTDLCEAIVAEVEAVTVTCSLP